MVLPRTLLNGWDVLVVDDEPDSLEVASYMLRYHGATVLSATNGEEGLAVTKQKKLKLIISDISMPVLDGWGFIYELKQNRATMDIPVIALTAHAMQGDRERAMAAGFHNYLTKPLTAKTFMQNLLRLLLEIPELADSLGER